MKIECEFGSFVFSTGEVFYGCNIVGKKIPQDEVLEFTGQHEDSKSNDDVSNVWFHKCNVTIVPQGLTKIFPNLKILDIENSNLKKLRKTNLVEYKNLKTFMCANNELKFLPANLFEDFGNLECISFLGNKLEFVEPNILDGLQNLKFVDFRANPNYSKFSSEYPRYKSQITIHEVKEELAEKFCEKFKFARELRTSEQNLRQEVQKLRTSENKLKQEIQKLRDDSIFRDIKIHIQDENAKDLKFEVGNHEFLVHKFLLTARSPTFAKLLSQKDKIETFKLADIPVDVFEQIINFVYTDELPCGDLTNVEQLFVTASHLEIGHLKDFAGSRLIHLVNAENAVEYFKLSNMFGHDELRKKAFDEIKKKHPNFDLKDELAVETGKVLKIIKMAEDLQKLLRNEE